MSSRRGGLKIQKSNAFDDFKSIKATELPVIPTVNFLNPTQGGLLYEPNIQGVYFANGTQWLPLGGGGGGGTVTSITAGVGLNGTPNPITGVGTIDMADTAVVPGTYGNGTNIAQFTVDQQGRLTGAANVPIAAIPGTSAGFSLLKSGAQNILPSVNTIITNWVIAPSPPYHDNTGKWNLATGVFTATANATVNIEISLSWQAGISNLGNRTTRIIYQPLAGIPLVAKESVTQADPNTNVATTQEVGLALLMAPGDEAWIEVSHTAPVNLAISAGNNTTLSGVEISV